MQHIPLDEQSIRKLTGDRFYQRGYQYYINGKVYGLSYNPNTNMWRGLVKGATVYTIRIYYNGGTDIEATCTCPAFATHDTCKHIAAVLLAITQDAQSNRRKFAVDQNTSKPAVNQQTDLFAKQLMHTFREQKEPNEAILTEFQLILTKANKNTQYALAVELKIGDKRPYVIRDLRGFFKAWMNGESYKVNHTFTFEPGEYFFHSSDQELLELMLSCYEQEKLFGNSYTLKMEQPRSIYLPPSVSDQFIEKLQQTNYLFKQTNKEEFSNIEFGVMTDQLQFKIDYLQSNAYSLELSDLTSYYFLSSYRYLIKNDHIYKVNYQQKLVLDKLFRILPLHDKKKQQISPSEMEVFVRNVMPQFEQIGRLEMTERMEEQLNTAPLEAKIWIDDQQGALKVEIGFQYGQTTIYPLKNEQQSNDIVKRETIKEQQVLRLLHESGFMEINQAMFLFNEDSIYHFLHDNLYQLEEIASVFLTHEVRNMMLTENYALQTSVDYRPSEGMLDISFDIEGITNENISQLLQALVEKKRYYRIPDGALIRLDSEEFDAFHKMNQNFSLSKAEMQEGKISIPAARSFQVEEMFEKSKHQFSKNFRDMLEQLKNPATLEFDLPDSLQAEMRDYQITGFQWLKTLSYYHLGGILADDMGLGKTLQTISYLLSEVEERQDHYQALVVAPASLLYNWKKEIEKFAPGLTSAVIAGSKEQRKTTVSNAENINILITSYPTLRQDVDLYEGKVLDCIILDEAQAIKNHLTLTAKAIRGLVGKQFFALSGTPIENSLDELWSIFYTISPGLYGNKKAFNQLDPQYIAKITRPFILRRVKKDVLEELPDKIESVQYSELTQSQKEVYLAYLDRIQQNLDQSIQEGRFEKGKLEILAGITRLRQICCHPSLFLENYQGNSGKLQQFTELIEDLHSQGKRALIFSQFSSMLKIIAQTLEQNGHHPFYLDGSTPSDQRMKMTEAFNEGERDFFLISLKAGGTGLNLTGADTVILFDLWWNPAVEEQAAGRAHRIGQKNVVQVIRFITEGTIEEKIYQLQHKKRELVEQIIQPGETLLSKLSEEDLRELLRFN
ncbi:Superfamily II DNA or RNA helicase, SNF2 family [Gracilibacillus ureilyticus]|uniref:Superfamily II DNA or RNA helicase, SNF2 family n=1 Tax=Gracilibacillus ureilyticus TaxID=531814 RepID=A0A1H9S820_9BACI|nr:DEAD/DEAH box helicase [Gracilibacillus ureilyticus]SER81162.1 Superfamily II DNA or RNA helicase, SNF2 family [Gracilibacillus ureilyticus]